MVDFKQVHPLGDLTALAKSHQFSGAGDAPIRIAVPARTVCAQLFASNFLDGVVQEAKDI